MPDPFFSSSKSRKRKRLTAADETASSRHAKNRKKFARSGPSSSKPLSGKALPGTKVNGTREKKGKRRVDEELDSDNTNDEDDGGVDNMDLRPVSDNDDAGDDGDEDHDETPAEKRLRLAKLYLETVKEDLADGELDAAEIDKDLISARLRHDVMENSGKVHLFIANSYDFSKPPEKLLRTRGHRLSLTSAVASEDGKYLFTASKEGSIIKWNLANGKKLTTFYKLRANNSEVKSKKGKGKAYNTPDVSGHTDEILALAVSSDGKYLASGGKDRKVGIWDVEKDEWVKGFQGHRDTISALAFRKGTRQLFSASFDRTLKIFDLSVMGYVETLFGHQDSVLHLDALRNETAVSVGGRDKTVRFWKVVDESQLLFRGGGKSAIRDLLEGGALYGLDDDVGDEEKTLERSSDKARKFVEGSIECVAMIDESTFLSGGDSGSICLWTIQRKKPIYTQSIAHGFHDVHSETEGLIQTPRWITAMACLRYSDLFASGSWEGDVRLWRLDSKLKTFSLAGNLPVPGFINSLQLITPPKQFTETVSWPGCKTVRQLSENATTDDLPARRKATIVQSSPVLLIAGVGQEHRFGRWLKVKGNGAVNCAIVAAFYPRTDTPISDSRS